MVHLCVWCIRVCTCTVLHLWLGRGRGKIEDKDVEDVRELRELLWLEVCRLHVLGPAVGSEQ